MGQTLRIATRETLQTKLALQIPTVFKRYVEQSGDVCADTDEAWDTIRAKISRGEPEVLLILYVPEADVEGFMYCKLSITGEAIISGAYLPLGLKDKALIDEALAIFERWARHLEARTAIFHTFRNPGAYRLMMQRGWKHRLTTFAKEL